MGTERYYHSKGLTSVIWPSYLAYETSFWTSPSRPSQYIPNPSHLACHQVPSSLLFSSFLIPFLCPLQNCFWREHKMCDFFFSKSLWCFYFLHNHLWLPRKHSLIMSLPCLVTIFSFISLLCGLCVHISDSWECIKGFCFAHECPPSQTCFLFCHFGKPLFECPLTWEVCSLRTQGLAL